MSALAWIAISVGYVISAVIIGSIRFAIEESDYYRHSDEIYFFAAIWPLVLLAFLAFWPFFWLAQITYAITRNIIEARKDKRYRRNRRIRRAQASTKSNGRDV